MPTFDRELQLSRGLIAVLHLSFAQWLAGLAIRMMEVGAELSVGAVTMDFRDMVSLIVASGLGLMGVVLLVGQRNDLRVSYLGAILLLSASAFSVSLMLQLEDQATRSGALARLLLLAPAEALLPFCFWRFAALFPSALNTRWMKRVLEAGTLLTLAGGVVFFVANLVGSLQHYRWLHVIDHRQQTGSFQTFLVGMCLIALVVSMARLANASQRDRVRARLLRLPFLLVVGMVVVIALGTVLQSPPADDVTHSLEDLSGLEEIVREVFADPMQSLLRVLFLVVALALIPAIAVSVSANRALNARLVAPKLLWSLGKQGLVLVLTTIPILVFLMIRLGKTGGEGKVTGQTWDELLFWFFSSLLAVGTFFNRRSRMLNHAAEGGYTANAELVQVLEAMHKVEHPRDWQIWLSTLPAAVGSSSVQLLGADRWSGQQDSVERSSLMDSSVHGELLALFRVRSEAVDLESSSPSENVVALSSQARRWLASQETAVLQPLFSTTGQLVGVLAVGYKLDQRPFDKPGLGRLRLLGQAMALFLEQRMLEELRTEGESRALPMGASIGGSTQASSFEAVQCFGCERVFASLVGSCPDCDHSTFTIEEPLVLAGKFQLERCIGTGTLGKVYQARDLVLDRKVAVKLIVEATAQGVRVLTREARAMAALESDHLATVYSTESVGNRLFVISELLTGGTLQEQMGVRPAHEVVSIGSRLLDALESLHRNDMVHGDLKPSNIGFDEQACLKLLDFGMVRLLDETVSLGTPERGDFGSSTVLPSGYVGTPLYSPPEAWRGEQVGVAVDLWPLGVILWELFTGQHPFERTAESPVEATTLTRAAILSADRSSVPVSIAGAPGLEQALARALDVEPAHRFVDVHAFRRGLLAI